MATNHDVIVLLLRDAADLLGLLELLDLREIMLGNELLLQCSQSITQRSIP